jgi:hypothetical protein
VLLAHVSALSFRGTLVVSWAAPSYTEFHGEAALACTLTDNYIPAMCGRVIQSSGPLRYAIVDGKNVRDSRVHNYPPRWNAAPSQELLVIRRRLKQWASRR